MMNLKNILSGAALAVAITATGTIGYAQQAAASPEQTKQERVGKRGGHHGKGFRHGRKARLFQQLNLTDAQKAQLKEIKQRHRESTKSLREEMRASRRSMKQVTQNGAFNESAVRAAAQASNNARVELAVVRAKMRSEMFAVLTAEQKTQLEQLKEQRRQKRQEMKAQRQAAKQAE